MHAAEGLAEFARTELKDLLHMSGRVLYSSHETLKPGNLYLLGHNPGGDPVEQAEHTIGRALDELPARTQNAYLDERWKGNSIGRSLLQQRVCWMLAELGQVTRDVAASNILFNRARDENASEFEKYVNRFWPVHRKIIEIVQPRMILTFSGSGYSFLREKFSCRSEGTCESGHGDWQCKRFHASPEMWVVKVPHLSRYKIVGKSAVIDWIKRCLSV